MKWIQSRIAIVALLPAVLGPLGSAQAEVVQIRGSGTVFSQTTTSGGQSSNGVPAILDAAFPLGASFTATATYDTTKVDNSYLERPGVMQYIGFDPGFTTVSMQAATHTLTPNPASALRYVTVVDSATIPASDSIGVGSRVLVDGATTFAGYGIVSSSVGVVSFGDTVLSSTNLPIAACLAAWQGIDIRITFSEGEYPTWTLYEVRAYGTPDREGDSDGDGVSDGVELLHACKNGCAVDTDSDGDTVLDTLEIQQGSDPCSGDTDGDGLTDDVDPDPLVPGIGADQLTEMVRDVATGVLDIPEASFAGPNANAERGRRSALSNRLNAAASAIQAGDLEEALQILRNVLRWLEDDQIMEDGPEKDGLRAEIQALIALVEAAIAG